MLQRYYASQCASAVNTPRSHAENNKTSYVYDGFDRLSQTLYPSGAKGAGTSNAADYEQLGYGSTSTSPRPGRA